jgi:long-chain fatty acid adenylase/transferase FadD26
MTAEMFSPPAIRLASLPEVLRLRSEQQPDDTAYVFLPDGETPAGELTYRQLADAVRVRAWWLRAAGLGGERVILLYPTCLEFVSALLGCMCAGVTAVPAQVPSRLRSLRRLRLIADDADTVTVLTTGSVRRELIERFGGTAELDGLTLVDTEAITAGPGDGGPDDRGGVPWSAPGESIALLQYTSGSTGQPKGVAVTHDNFRSNVAETAELWPAGTNGTVVSWLPLFHDMGLLFGVVLPLWAGMRCYLMPPEAFIRDPVRWLAAISRFGGTHAAAPSFGYELCARSAAERPLPADLDLSSWRVAANGAEPVRWRTVEEFTAAYTPAGFRPEAMCPGYGLAENTLKATGSPVYAQPTVLWVSPADLGQGRVTPLAAPDGADVDGLPGRGGATAVPLVGCGLTAGATQVRIVDPGTRAARLADQVGEVWVSGPCVAAGYYRKPVESAETFGARIAGHRSDGTWLRTGDLGFLHDGELFITGRLKDVIIRKGRNYYPQDIELSAERAHGGLRPNCAAAFSVDDGERELLVIVVEADGRTLRDGEDELRQRIRDAVREGQRLEVDAVIVTRRGRVPKTSSGKVQRREARIRYLAGEFGAPAATARH